MKQRPSFSIFGLVTLATALCMPLVAQQHESIVIDSQVSTTAFPHFWEQTFGSGRAILSLRESYRNDLSAEKKVTDLQYVRFHGVLLDEVGVYDEDKQGNPRYNFTDVDQIYGGLQQNGIRSLSKSVLCRRSWRLSWTARVSGISRLFLYLRATPNGTI